MFFLGLVFIACSFLLSTYLSYYKVIPISIIAYSSFISLILLKDKTKLFNNLFLLLWKHLFTSINKLLVVNSTLFIIFSATCWYCYIQYKRYHYNAYVTVYKKNSANFVKGEQVELLNLITKDKIVIKTDETGRGIFHVAVPSVWQKTYKNYRFPEEKVESIPYSFKVDLTTIKIEAVQIEENFDSTVQNIRMFQLPKEYLDRCELQVICDQNIKSGDYLLDSISNLNAFVEHDGYIVNYNKLLKVPNCVAYKIFQTQNSFRRPSRFLQDTELQSALPRSYTGSGYDRGSLISSHDMSCHGEKAVYNAFLTSVIAPQAPKLNRLTWHKLEDYARRFASDTIFIISGTLFLNIDENGNAVFPVIGDEKIAVPSHYYRIISRRINGTTSALAFVIPNNNDIEVDISKYSVSIKDLEEMTGICFFNRLLSAEQKAIISRLWD